MTENKVETRKIIEAAITAAIEASMTGIDAKLQEAINLGVTIGAAAGAEIGAKMAVETMKKERSKFKQQEYEWEYHNTKLLLRNYRRLNSFYENAVFDTETAEEADEDFEKIMRSVGEGLVEEEIFVASIQRNFIATKIIMTHVNKMLGVYKNMCNRSHRHEDARHWRVLEGLYIANDYTTASKIAKQENIAKRTVYKDVDICVADLTTLFFGIGGMERFLTQNEALIGH